MKILVCPLNWGLGHATRCVPLIKNMIERGDEVTIAADGQPLRFLQQEFPQLNYIEYPSYPVRYSSGRSQVGAMISCMPGIVKNIVREHRWLKELLQKEHFDHVVSDNRFGLWNKKVHSIYITHQLMIKMPRWLCFLEPVAWLAHQAFISCYDECWVPDFSVKPGLSGDLSHRYPLQKHVKFSGPLSRFSGMEKAEPVARYDTIVLISGVEPQRALFEGQMIERFQNATEPVLILKGLPLENSRRYNGQMTICSHIPTAELAALLLGAEHIIARSGYSTIMDLASLNCLHKAEFIPTPGQTEQEYLAVLHKKREN